MKKPFSPPFPFISVNKVTFKLGTVGFMNEPAVKIVANDGQYLFLYVFFFSLTLLLCFCQVVHVCVCAKCVREWEALQTGGRTARAVVSSRKRGSDANVKF